MSKIRVGIVFGGRSEEHSVSLMSANSIINEINSEKYEVVKIGITRYGEWKLCDTELKEIKDDSWQNSAIDLQIHQLPDLVDIAFPIIHGTYGEDGKIQGLFEMLGMPYCGCDVLSSAIAMDKITAKSAFINANIPCGKYVHFTSHDTSHMHDDPDVMNQMIYKVESELNFPVFIKPANLGSSIGITCAANRSELVDSLCIATKYDNRVIVEERINAREIEISVLGNDNIILSEPGEITASQEFYDFESKYSEGANEQLSINAKLDIYTKKQIKNYAALAYKELNCSGFARVDFFLSKDSNEIFINEINTIPGFTKYSMYPKMWEANGIGYSDLIERIIELGYEKYNVKNN